MDFGKKNKEILAELDKLVIGHAAAKKMLINVVSRSRLRYLQKYVYLTSNLLSTSKCLIAGGSGTGKTFLVESLKKIVDFPLLKIDASRLTVTGAGDGIKSADLEKQIESYAYSLVGTGPWYHSTEGVINQMIVFLDEFDKLATSYDGSSSGKWQKNTQANFLSLFDNRDRFEGVTFIFAGAFSGLEKSSYKKLGFTQSSDEVFNDYDEELIKYGFIPELVGRLTNMAFLDKFSEDDYRFILTEHLVPEKIDELKFFNINNFELDEKTTNEIVKKAFKSGQGVRYLKRELNNYCQELEFDYEDRTFTALDDIR